MLFKVFPLHFKGLFSVMGLLLPDVPSDGRHPVRAYRKGSIAILPMKIFLKQVVVSYPGMENG